MPSVNKVTLIGNCGRDPEVRYTPSGAAVCNLSIATSRQWKDKTSGERQEEVEWHRVTFFDRMAEVVGEFVKKGKPIYVEGRIKTRKYADKDGAERYVTEIMATDMQLLGGRDGDEQPRSAAPQRSQPAAQPQRAAASKPSTGFDDMDDDIPF